MLNLYSATLYNNVYERLSLLFASDEFKEMYAPYLGNKKLDIESLYDERAPFDSEQFFTLSSKQTAQYLRVNISWRVCSSVSTGQSIR